MGYSECVQECIRFVNNNSQMTPASSTSSSMNVAGISPAGSASHSNNSVDQATRQRLISNLMRQFQSINSPSSHSPIHNSNFSSQVNTQLQLENITKEQNQQQHLLPKNIKIEPTLSNNYTSDNQCNQISSPVNFNQTMPSNGSSSPSSPSNIQNSLSDNASNSNSNAIISRNNFRRSSVSPISSSSSSSTSSSSSLSNFTNENTANNNSNHQNANLNVSESSSYHALENSEQEQDLLNNSCESPKIFDTSSSQYDQSVWRPW